MFHTFFFAELKYNFKRPMIYIFMGILMLMTFGATVSDNVVIGGSVGNVYKNAPYIITIYVSILSIFCLLIATAFFNNAALKDHKNDFNEILFSTPLRKGGYYFGRFFAALILSTIPMLGVFLGILIGSALAPAVGWVDADRFGRFYLETFVNNYLLFILPNMFFAGSIIFAMANKWKSTIISFMGTLVIIMGYIIASVLKSDMENETLAALTDIFGIEAYSLQTKYFTPIEKNTLSPGFSGLILLNRAVWFAIGTVIILFSFLRFSFMEKVQKVRMEKSVKTEKPKITFHFPELNPTNDFLTTWAQFKSFFYTNLISIVKSITFKILFLFSAVILIANLIGGFEYFGLQSYPLTYKLIDLIGDASGIFVIIILVFFSGELIWRDRESKINEVVDATPHTSFISLTAKALSLVGVTVILHWVFVFCGIIYQLLNGYSRIEPGVYFLSFVYSDLMTYIIWSGVMIMIQVVVNNKYIGYFVSILIVFLSRLILSIFDIQTNMLAIGAGPYISYSDMDGFGPGVAGAMWFNLYWILFAVMCIMIAGTMWNRGTINSLKDKLHIAKKQVPKSYRMAILVTFVLWLLVGGFVYYNTIVLNEFMTSDEQEVQQADYEKKYKKYEKVHLPKVTGAKYFIDIFPEERDVHVKAILVLTNETGFPIDSLHFNVEKEWNTELTIPNSQLVYEDKDFGYQIYTLKNVLLPGEKIEIEIRTAYISKGFENGIGNTSIVNNGTFMNNFEILPSFGYNEGMELGDKNTRKKYGLKPKNRMPKLQKDCTTDCMSNYLTNGLSDFINVETVISTSGDQIAIAPGSLIKQWKVGDRNYYHYKVDHPSQNFYSFMSARYEVAKRKLNDIDIEVYYDKKHEANVTMMLDAVERSLKYYITNFGHYYHKQCRIIEFPRYASFAQAFPGTMPYSEAIGFVINMEDENENNIIDAVIAHEMAHQWWAHQVIGATMQGCTILSESFAEYSSLMTMKNIAKTPMKMREFIKYDHNRYLMGRSDELENELPLFKVENQMHIHYGKGSVIMYALQDYIGEDKVNQALREFLDEFKYCEPPYPTSLDFLKHLEPLVPDSLNYLVTDWFKEITLYDNRMEKSTYKKLDNGKFEVTLNIKATKLKADSIGNEKKVPIDDWIDIGVFADDDEEELLFEKRVKINQPKMSFTFVVNRIPMKGAIDPRRLLIDRVYEDNIKVLKEE